MPLKINLFAESEKSITFAPQFIKIERTKHTVDKL
jgi:hypothetical protein